MCGIREIEKYSLGTNRNKDLYGAYHMTIIYSIGSNQLNDAVYYINQSKNVATQLLKEFDGKCPIYSIKLDVD